MSENVTSNFLKAIQKHADIKKAELENEVEKFRKAQLEEGKDHAIRDAYNLIQNEIASKNSAVMSEFSDKIYESRRELFKRRLEMIKEIKNEVIKKLDDFTQTDEYISYLESSLSKIKDIVGDSKCDIYIRECDKEKISPLLAILNIDNITVDTAIKAGGLKVYSKDLGIIIDETLDGTLNEKIDDFISTCELKVI